MPPAAGHFGLAELVGLRPQPDSPNAVVEAFCARYTSPKTREDQARRLKELLRGCSPVQLRDADVLDWARGAGKDLANNSVRNRLALARTFLRWCDRRGIGPQLDLEEEFAVLRRSYPATYGKVQDRHPARYLDQQQVRALVAACADGTWQGIRDEIAIRFGLLGIRAAWGSPILPDTFRRLLLHRSGIAGASLWREVTPLIVTPRSYRSIPCPHCLGSPVGRWFGRFAGLAGRWSCRRAHTFS